MGSLMHHQKSEREEALAHFSSIVDEGKEYISTRAWTMDGTEQNLPLLAEVMEGRKTDVRTVTSAVRRLKKAAAVVSDEQLQEAALLNVVYDYVVTNHDLDPVGLLTSSFARSLQFLNTINTSSSTMKLLLDEVNERADYSSIFDLPYVLSRACSRSQQQRQPLTKKKWRLVAAATAAPSSWKIAYVYVLCRLALDDLKRMPFLFTLLDWKQRVQSLMDKPLRTSRAAGSGMALFLFDWFLELDGRRETMPEGMTLKTVLGDLIGPPYK